MSNKNGFLPDLVLSEAADCLKVMAHPVRLRIVEILVSGDFSVQEIAARCQLPHSQTCEHLRLMKGHGFLASDRRGRSVYYKIANPRLSELIRCIRTTCNDKPRE